MSFTIARTCQVCGRTYRWCTDHHALKDDIPVCIDCVTAPQTQTDPPEAVPVASITFHEPSWWMQEGERRG